MSVYRFRENYGLKDDEGNMLRVTVDIEAYAPEGTYVSEAVLQGAAEEASDKVFDEGFHLE